MENKHSGLGIASFILSLIAGLSLFGTLVVTAIVQARNPEASQSFKAILGLTFIGLTLFDVLAVALGVAAVFQKQRKKIFGVLGLSFSSLIIIGMTAMIIFGLAMRRMQ
jgi:hypothetical protein